MWPPFGPVEAQSAEMTAGRTQRRQVDPEFGEKSGARLGDFSGFVADHDIFIRNQSVGEIHAETTGKVVVAVPGQIPLPAVSAKSSQLADMHDVFAPRK